MSELKIHYKGLMTNQKLQKKRLVNLNTQQSKLPKIKNRDKGEFFFNLTELQGRDKLEDWD